jgi:hypothetical protein
MVGLGISNNSGSGFYKPDGINAEYDRIQNQPGLPGVTPPSGGAVGAPPPPAMLPTMPIDPDAPDILDLIRGGRFDPPFTVSLMKRDGIQTFKSDAGIKSEANFVFCRETVRNPSDLLRILAGVESEVFKPLNRMTLEFQFMLYLGYRNGALDVPSMSDLDLKTAKEEEEVALEAEEVVADGG